MKNLVCLTGVLLLFAVTTYAQDCTLNEDAQRYMARGNVAIESAQSNADYLSAVEEFKKALQYAPNCPDIYYNIALCYDKSMGSDLFKGSKGFAEAIENYKKYLALKPNAQDKQTVQTRIYELEYKQEKIEFI